MRKNYLLDLGGVIFHLNYELTYSSFEKLTGLKSELFFHQLKQPGLFDQFERGEFDEPTFITKFKKEFVPRNLLKKLETAHIVEAWNAMLIGIPEKNLKFLEALALENDLYLLSNTNIIHWQEVLNILKTNRQWDRFKACFKHLFLSFEMGSRKPEAVCYQHCLKKLGLKASEMIFLDDNLANVQAALSLGIDAKHYPHNQLLEDFFR